MRLKMIGHAHPHLAQPGETKRLTRRQASPRRRAPLHLPARPKLRELSHSLPAPLESPLAARTIIGARHEWTRHAASKCALDGRSADANGGPPTRPALREDPGAVVAVRAVAPRVKAPTSQKSGLGGVPARHGRHRFPHAANEAREPHARHHEKEVLRALVEWAVLAAACHVQLAQRMEIALPLAERLQQSDVVPSEKQHVVYGTAAACLEERERRPNPVSLVCDANALKRADCVGTRPCCSMRGK